MNILGEGFPSEIIKQVNQRQKIYGSGYDPNSFRTSEDLVYLNSNTAWCKLISSTYIDNINIINNNSIKNLNLDGDQLARKFILFNGTFNIDNGEQKAGIDSSNSLLGYNYAYGIGGTEFGINPMMGIQSAIINYKNRGSIRTATVNIKAWNKVQFEIIDVLYLRLGFSVLLEWGHSIYYNNDGTLESKPTNNSLAYDFLEATSDYKEFLNKIYKKRLETFGNYDAMFAKVTNFHWSFKPDGSYDIVLNLVSVGDVVESFKIKGNAPTSINTDNASVPNPPTFIDELKKSAQSSELANYLYKCVNLFGDPKNTGQSCFLYNTSTNTDWTTYWNPDGTFASASNDPGATKDICVIVPLGGTLGVPPPPSGYAVTATDNVYSGRGQTYKETNVPSSLPPQNSYFIRLGNLLKFIEEGIMYKIPSSSPEVSGSPLLNFDYDVETNLMHSPPQLMGYDPRLAMVRTTIQFPGGGNGPVIPSRTYFDQTNGTVTNFADDFDVTSTTPELGKIMNIYINFQFVLNKLKELENKDTNEVLLLDFIKAILAGINSSFGGYSKLDTFIDENTNTLKIIDQNPLPSISDTITYINSKGYNIPKELAFFDLYGYKPKTEDIPTTAGFIKEFNFTTELTPEFSTMISVAATSNGNVVGENNTALSKLNKGLVDRYKKEVIGGGAQQSPVYNAADVQQTLKNNYLVALREFEDYAGEGFQKYVNDLYQGIYINEEIDSYKDSFTIYFKLWKKFKKAGNEYYNYNPEDKSYNENFKFQPGTGFIPFNLSLKMNGLSGIKLGSRFLIDTSYLPSNYPDTVDFLIKNLSHEIKDNTWTTSLESYCIAKSPEKYDEFPDEFSEIGLSTSTDINVTPTYTNPSTRKIINTFGWPIILNTTTNPFYATSIRVDSVGRNEFRIDPKYTNNNIVRFSYKGINSNIHKALSNPLRQVIDLIEQAGYLKYAQNIQSTIYARDIKGSPGNLSGHSFGLSIDINPDKFPQGQFGYDLYQAAIKNPSDPNYNYAKPIQIIANSGLFNWGGNFSNKDAHHFTVKPYIV